MRASKPIATIAVVAIAAVFPLLQSCSAQDQPAARYVDNLLPMPASITYRGEPLPIDGALAVNETGYHDERLDHAVADLRRRLLSLTQTKTGSPANTGARHKPFRPVQLTVHCDAGDGSVQTVDEDESYILDIDPQRAGIIAHTPVGVLHGIETLNQLVEKTPNGYQFPGVHIEDRPRFVWRGLLIDTARHFMPVDVVERNLDTMAACKMNVLHWHLSDDQGFRVQSKVFPLLNELGSNGQYYTQAQIRDVIAYARDRGIRVVPEFDMPGHSLSWFAGYPDLTSTAGTYQPGKHWGIYDTVMDPTRESTYQFLDKFIGEMADLFPDHYFHIGGDEVNGNQWAADPRIQAFMQAHNLKDTTALQAYFNQRIHEIVTKHGKIMVGWDEVLDPTLPADVMVQSWRGNDSLTQAVSTGHDAILSHGYYLDYPTPTSRYYANDPLPATTTLTSDEQARVLGGEACMWAEWVTPQIIDMRIWPRCAAVAERLWSPKTITDPSSLYQRMAPFDVEPQQIETKMLAGLAGSDSIDDLKTTVEALGVGEAFYDRRGGTQGSLNAFVDAIPFDSIALDEFYDAVRNPSQNAPTIRVDLTRWHDAAVAASPMMTRHDGLKDYAGAADAVAAVSSIGLHAVDYIQAGSSAPSTWVDRQTQALKAYQEQQAGLRINIVKGVEALVAAAGP